ncbi:hypothetical protein BsWGS_19883 [Bradybaena similaris]
MTHGLIPVKQSSLPGLIKLPRRYEKDSANVPVYSNHPRVSEPTGPFPEEESLSERLNDLMMATLWIKQELILLRQHDILLKRQFFNIHHSITSLQPSQKPANIETPTPSSACQSSTLSTSRILKDHIEITAPSQPSNHHPDTGDLQAQIPHPITQLDSNLETLLLRPAPFAKACSEYGDDDSDGGDVFYETEFYRPRATSMRTSRDLAASARRRGSKDLI